MDSKGAGGWLASGLEHAPVESANLNVVAEYDQNQDDVEEGLQRYERIG